MTSTNSKTEAGSTAKAGTQPAAGSASTSDEACASLQKENNELRRMSQYRSLFLARLAHELRTPLTSILGFSEILLNQEKLTAAQRNFCERIQNSAHQLQNSLNQLSDLARLESGQTQLAREEFSVVDILRESVAAVARRAEKKQVDISCGADDALPPIISDRGRLRQVIYNVLAYAITRSPENNTVELSARPGMDGLELTIRDHGEPLANPSEIGTLDAANDKSGTGELEVAIARQNIQMLGGALTAENLDGGLELKIKLPPEPPRESQD